VSLGFQARKCSPKPVVDELRAQRRCAAGSLRCSGSPRSRARGTWLEFIAEMERIAHKIAARPFRFPTIGDDGARRALGKRFHYFLAFFVLEDRVRIVAVMHQRQHPDGWKARSQPAARSSPASSSAAREERSSSSLGTSRASSCGAARPLARCADFAPECVARAPASDAESRPTLGVVADALVLEKKHPMKGAPDGCCDPADRERGMAVASGSIRGFGGQNPLAPMPVCRLMQPPEGRFLQGHAATAFAA